MEKIFMFPGQGSQKLRMGEDLFTKFPEYIIKANQILGYDLKELCLTDPKQQLNQTQFTQPALYVVNALAALNQEDHPVATIGHSLGEYNALLQAKVFDFEIGLKLVQKRGELMSKVSGGGMAAIIGLSVQQIEDVLAEFNNNSIEIANYNSPMQTVISGLKDDIFTVQKAFQEAGAHRFVILPTSGSFHSKHMKPSQEKFSKFIEQFDFKNPTLPVIANINAQAYDEDIKSTLVGQISRPVCWVQSVKHLISNYPNAEFVECGPSKVLSGLLKQITKMKSVFFSFFFLIGFIAIAQQKKLNVLFIISDDLTATAVSAYENKACKTPNIDKLASKGTLYTRAYAQYPVCGPSRASLMSGYYPSATKTFGYVSGRKNIGNSRKTWSQLFKDNGYYTARVSKIYHMKVPLDIEKGLNGQDDEASWDERYNSQGPEWKAKGEAELVQGNPDGKIERKGGNVMTIVKASGDDLVHSDGKTAKKAIELIKEHKNDPFFLAVGFVRPHVPFVAPKEYFKPYPYNEVVMPKKVKGDWDDIPKRGINYVTSVNGEMSVTQEKKAVSAYYAAVSYMDTQVGKVLDALKEEGLEDNTIVIFTSDHGFHLGEHNFWMKRGLHEESVRVPLIIKVPGEKPAVCDSLVELLDLYPTTAELAGIKTSKYLQGKSLVKTIKDPKYSVRDMAFSVTRWGKSFLLRTEKWAYIQYNENASAGIELFDMENDPKQFTNLAKNPKYAEVVDKFKKKLKKKLLEVRTNDLGFKY